jgi:hypothetical protein
LGLGQTKVQRAVLAIGRLWVKDTVHGHAFGGLIDWHRIQNLLYSVGMVTQHQHRFVNACRLQAV